MFDRTSQRSWDLKHLRTVSTRLPIPEYDRYGKVAAASGLTRYALTKALVLRSVEDPAAAVEFLGGAA